MQKANLLELLKKQNQRCDQKNNNNELMLYVSDILI